MTGFDGDRIHGGPDPLGVPTHDFSTNSNACGPCPQAEEAVRRADATRYPDPSYSALCERIAALHDIAFDRVALATSASEFIFRITALAGRRGVRRVCVPRHGYGEYRHAAAAWGMEIEVDEAGGGLTWACDPSSPLGDSHAGLKEWVQCCARKDTIGVLDRAYEPLRLEGTPELASKALDSVWQLFSPNKALGLTGVRAAYAIAPARAAADVKALNALCASWPLGAHGVAMLKAWCDPAAQAWLAATRETLRDWKSDHQALCGRLGWKVLPSRANFFCVETASHPSELAEALRFLRGLGIKLRDAQSFGLAGHLRLAVLPPHAQDALEQAWRHWLASPRERFPPGVLASTIE